MKEGVRDRSSELSFFGIFSGLTEFSGWRSPFWERGIAIPLSLLFCYFYEHEHGVGWMVWYGMVWVRRFFDGTYISTPGGMTWFFWDGSRGSFFFTHSQSPTQRAQCTGIGQKAYSPSTGRKAKRGFFPTFEHSLSSVLICSLYSEVMYVLVRL